MFSQSTIEALNYYVYLLKDPRNNTTFYVGKGKGNRIFQHINDALETTWESDKLNLIREIKKSGFDVEHYIIRHGLNEDEAFLVESVLIDLLNLDSSITNLVSGHDCRERGLKSVNEIKQLYEAAAVIINEPCIIININRFFKRFMTEGELYETTRKSWKVGARKNHAKYAIASYKGLVRAIYEIESWESIGNRWGFIGKPAGSDIQSKYLNKSLANYYKKGSQNPIKYTF